MYQLHREPVGWSWANSGDRIEFETTKPKSKKPNVALQLSISADINSSRIYSELGVDTSIWEIRAKNAHNDCMRFEEDAAEFRRLLRSQLNAIKVEHGEGAVINLFPAIPVSAAVEIGRVWQPKADLRLRVYDQGPGQQGFSLRHTIE